MEYGACEIGAIVAVAVGIEVAVALDVGVEVGGRIRVRPGFKS